MDPIGLLQMLMAQLRSTDASPEADGSQHEDAVCDEPGCALDRLSPVQPEPRVIRLYDQAARATYSSGSLKGKNKRTLYPSVDLSKRQVVIGLHQMGVDVSSTWPSYHKVTCHRAIRTDAAVLEVHPLPTRLVCTNRLDRAPWHCIGIEFAGNFEALDGSGRWPPPATNGHGRASEAQIVAGRWLVKHLVHEVAELGGHVVGIVPHIVAGRDKRGKPNRQACPGSRIWSEVGEWSGAELGLAIPGPTFAVGGLPIPATWYGPYRARCRFFL